MDKKRLRITLKVLKAVKKRFPDTINFINNMMEEQCQEEKISVEEVIFLQVKKQKSQLKKCILSYSKYVKDTLLS